MGLPALSPKKSFYSTISSIILRSSPGFKMICHVTTLLLIVWTSNVAAFCVSIRNRINNRININMVDDDMLSTYDELALRLFTTYRKACEINPNPRQYWLCIAGGPGE